MNVAVFTGHHIGQLFALHGHTQALAYLLEQLGAALLMGNVPGPLTLWCGAFAQIVHEAGHAHRQRRIQLRTHVEHHHEVHTCVDFRMMLSTLRYAPQSIHFRQQNLQRTAGFQHVKHARGLVRHQAFRQFLPHTFGYQMLDFASVHHVLHELQGFGGHLEFWKARRKAGQSQDAHRIFAKGGGDMSEGLVFQILPTVIRVDAVC